MKWCNKMQILVTDYINNDSYLIQNFYDLGITMSINIKLTLFL